MDVFEFREKRMVRASDAAEEIAHASIGAAIEVHRHLGPGLPELAYRTALSHELTLRKLPHAWEVPLPIHYKEVKVAEGRLDLIVADLVILEINVVEVLTQVHHAQALSYLKAARLELAILVNFNVAILKDGIKRIINTIS